MPVIGTETEDDEGYYVRDKGKNHTAAAPEQVGDSPAGNFYKIYEEFPKADKDPDLSERKPLLHEEEYDKGLEIPLVL